MEERGRAQWSVIVSDNHHALSRSATLRHAPPRSLTLHLISPLTSPHPVLLVSINEIPRWSKTECCGVRQSESVLGARQSVVEQDLARQSESVFGSEIERDGACIPLSTWVLLNYCQFCPNEKKNWQN